MQREKPQNGGRMIHAGRWSRKQSIPACFIRLRFVVLILQVLRQVDFAVGGWG